MCSPRASISFGPRVSELLQLNESLLTMDKTRFWLTWGELAWARSKCQRILKPIVLSTVAERKGTILATLALHLVEYLWKQRIPQHTRLCKPDYDSRMIRHAPWRWRQRLMAIQPSRSKLERDDARARVPKWCFSVRFHCYQPGRVIHRRELLSNLIYALDHLPALLKHAAENDDLITFASRHSIFPQQAFRFPQLRKQAQNAVNAYLFRFLGNSPAVPFTNSITDGPDEHWQNKPGSAWDRITNLFSYVLMYICFLWVTWFA